MPLFTYKVRTKKGKIIEGVLEAQNLEEAEHFLEDDKVMILEIKKKLWDFSFLTPLLQRIPVKDKVVFARQLAVMVSASLPLVKSLRILVKQTPNKALQKIIENIANELESGIRFSMALAKYPKVFNFFFVNMVRSGETTGELADTLVYLADQMEKDYDLTSRIKGAMIYPIFIFIGLIAVGVLMMVVVIPKMTAQLRELGGNLPIATQILIATSNFMSEKWYVLLSILVILLVLIRLTVKTEKGKWYFDYIVLKMPLFGQLFQKIYIVRITRSLSTLISGRVPITKGLRVVAGVVGNAVYKDILIKTIKEVEDGNSLSTVFSQSNLVPAMLSQMIQVGEQTGRLGEVLEKVTMFYSREVDNVVANLVSLIEPVVIIIMGLAVGFMVAAIIMPTFNMANQL